MKNVKITIEGQIGTGKTTIAATISTILKNFGYQVTHHQHETDILSLNPIDTERAQQTHVTIEERQLPRV